HHVMFAVRTETDIANQHEVVVFPDFAEGALEHLGRTFAIPGEEFIVSVDDPFGCIEEALAVRKVPRVSDEGAHRRFRFFARRAWPLWYWPQMLGYGLRPWLDDGVHDGLSVRPARTGPGVSPGRPHRSTHAWKFVPRVQSGRRIPILEGFNLI